LFAVLGDDVEDASATAAPVTEVVKKTTSTKKGDENPRANPAKANPNRPKPTGNEAAFRDKAAGRSSNRSRPADETPRQRRPGGREARDRHSREGKVDTDKKVRQGWGDNKKKGADEVAAEVIAKEDASEDVEETEAAPVEEEDNTQTLEQYLAELKLKSAELPAREARRANEGVEDAKWSNAAEFHRNQDDEILLAASATKSLRQKTRKEKQTIEPEITFTSPRSERSGGPRESRRGRGGNASGRGRGGNGPRGGNAPRGGNGPRGRQGGRSSEPGVNITSQDEFPTLGA
jgi:plasminogen activator inhibitor 1 RNA-binding protein